MRLIAEALITIPLTLSNGWESLTFRKIPPNSVEHATDGLHINVAKSSSPLIYKFSQTETIVRVQAEGTMTGTIQIPDPKKQGRKGFDDLPLRVGLVLEGTKTLAWYESAVAAPWIKKMHSIAPQGKGLDHVLFLDVMNDPSLVGEKRDHYLNSILKEEVVAAVDKNGRFKIDHTFSTPQKVMGLWLSSSGDNLGSTFKIHLSNLQLTRASSQN